MEKEVFDKLIKSLCELIRIPSRFSVPELGAPRGKAVKDAIDYCLSLGLELGFTSCGAKEGVVGWLDVGEGEDSFGILAHVDVVPEGEGWSVDPYGGVVLDGRIYGRGASDDKGPLLCAMYAVHSLLKEGKTPKKRIRVIIGGDEEGFPKVDAPYAINDRDAMDIYRESEDMPASGFSPDADFPVINAEKGILHVELSITAPDGLSEISGGERPNIVPSKARALYDGKPYTAEGVSAHGSTPEKGSNAIISLLSSLSTKNPIFSDIHKCFESIEGEGLRINCEDEESGKLTLNLGIVEMRENEIVFTVDIRYPVTKNKADILRTIEGAWQGELKELRHNAPLYVSKDDPLIKSLTESYEEITGERGEPIAIGGGTYARELPRGVAFGAAFPWCEGVAHMKDEYMSLEDLQRTFEIYKRAIEKLCF